MLSASQEIYIRRIRLVVQNRGNLLDAQYPSLAFRLLINIDRDVVTTSGGDWPPICLRCNEPPGPTPNLLRVSYLAQTRKPPPVILYSVECADGAAALIRSFGWSRELSPDQGHAKGSHPQNQLCPCVCRQTLRQHKSTLNGFRKSIQGNA